MSDHPAPVRPARRERHPSPFRLNLEQQRKRAKDLLQALRAGEPDAIRRFRLHHPAAGAAAPRLSEAQLVVARELGMPSWPRLKAHIAAMDQSWERIAQGGAAPDRDMTTLHIRCGSDIGPTLQEGGFSGDFLEYSDPFCQGPVLEGPEWLAQRADFLAGHYGAGTAQSREEIAAKLLRAESALHAAPSRYERVVLWFEHDTYDQLILARCLAHFAGAPPRRLELISPARYPGGTRFIGLGQLPPEALRLLWNERVPVPAAGLRAGQAVWSLLRRPDPRPLADLARSGLAALPPLAPAVRRHLQELPWTSDGLSLTERLVLEMLAEAPHSAAQAFRRLMLEREPLPWLTDLMFHDILEGLKRAARPVLSAERDAEAPWPQERLAITPAGRAVLAGQLDALALGPPARWVGGVHIATPGQAWRWDEASASAVPG